MHLVDKIAKVRRASRQMSNELGREATDDELGEEIGIASEKIARLKSLAIRPASIDMPISDDDATKFGELIGTRKRKRRSNCYATRTCSVKWTGSSICSTNAR